MAHDEQTGEVDEKSDEQWLEVNIDKEIAKLGYFLEETDQIIEDKNYREMEAVNNRASIISELILQTEELKIDNGKTSRSVRQWEKETKSKYAAFIKWKERLVQQLKNKR